MAEEKNVQTQVFSGKVIGWSIIGFCVVALVMAVYYMTPEYRTTISIPDEVKVIEENAYKNSIETKTVIIGQNVEEIGNWAFFGCTAIEKNVVIPAKVKKIGWAAFAGVKSVSVDHHNTTFFSIPVNAADVKITADKVTFTGGSTKAGNVIIGKKDNRWTLIYCSPIVEGEYTVPAGVEAIEHYAFYNCDKLTRINLPDSVKSLGSAAFMNCKALTGINIPAAITELRRSLFEGCEKLTGIKFDKVVKIDYAAFRGCKALTEVVFPDTMEEIATYAFFQCENLKNAEIYLEKNKKNEKVKAEAGKVKIKIGHNAFNDVHPDFKLVERGVK